MRFGYVLLAGVLGLLMVTPAQAEMVTVEKKRFFAFEGERCGDRDRKVVRIPRRARNVQLVTPSAGTMLLDFDEQEEIARMLPLKVKRKKRRAIVRAEGAGDICARPQAYEDIGWQTAAYDVIIRFKRPAPRN